MHASFGGYRVHPALRSGYNQVQELTGERVYEENVFLVTAEHCTPSCDTIHWRNIHVNRSRSLG